MAGRQGLEPRFTGPEPVVLPLNDLPVVRERAGDYSRCPGRTQRPHPDPLPEGEGVGFAKFHLSRRCHDSFEARLPHRLRRGRRGMGDAGAPARRPPDRAGVRGADLGREAPRARRPGARRGAQGGRLVRRHPDQPLPEPDGHDALADRPRDGKAEPGAVGLRRRDVRLRRPRARERRVGLRGVERGDPRGGASRGEGGRRDREGERGTAPRAGPPRAGAEVRGRLPDAHREGPVRRADRREARPPPSRGRGGEEGAGRLHGDRVHRAARRAPVVRLDGRQPDRAAHLPDRAGDDGDGRRAGTQAEVAHLPAALRDSGLRSGRARGPARQRAANRRGGRQPPEGAVGLARQEGPRPPADAPRADDPRVDRALDGARPGARLRGELRRDVVPDDRQARQVPRRIGHRELQRRPHAQGKPLDVRLRRRRREDEAVPDHPVGDLRRLPDDPRPGAPDRPGRVDGVLLRRLVRVGPVPADAERLARAGENRDDARRPRLRSRRTGS